ncbi:hypothetical protein PVAG01_02071 [Phlyctema vagabunda]|uniref:Uncharacterized protein n=1 Tax=Phlyctema vagabunda TaxID=108571 RepID=A0ABR4PPP4_9HELO
MSYRQHIAQHTTLMVPGQSARSPAPRLPSNPSPDDITPSDQPLQDASNSRNIDKSRRKRKPVKDTFEGREAEGQAAQPEPKDGAASPLDSNPDTRGEGSTVHELDTDGASSSGGHGCDADLVPPIIVTSPTDSTDSGLE